jgi:predicted AlkP superfamily phosphohydrolase/phosphomutase
VLFIRSNIIWSIFSGLLISGTLLLIIVLNNPKFIDSFVGLLIFFIFIPLLGGVLWGILQSFFTALLKKVFHISISERGIQLVPISLFPAIAFSLLLILWLHSSLLLEFKRGALYYSLFTILFILVTIGLVKLLKKFFSTVISGRKYLWLSVLFISLSLIIAVVSCSPILFSHKGKDSKNKVLILGFDGASWNVINPLLKKGEMPNLEKLMRSGSYGNLKSAHPMLSPIIWNTIASGKSYKKHGVLSFSYPSYSVRCSRIWDILEERGSSIGLCGYFQTWPPWKTNGFIIPDYRALGAETYPPRLSFLRKMYIDVRNKKISAITGVKYGILSIKNGLRLSNITYISHDILSNRFSITEALKLDDHYKKRIIKLKLYSDVFTYLTSKYPPDFSIFYSNIPDNISHLYWKYMEPEKFDNVKEEEIAKYSGVIPMGYREMDRVIGQVLESVGDKTTIFVKSDHGFKAFVEGDRSKSFFHISSQRLLNLLGISEKAEALHQGKRIYIKIYDDFINETDAIIKLFNSITVKETGNRLLKVNKFIPGYINIVIDRSNTDLEDKLINIRGSYIKFTKIVDKSLVADVSGDHAINGVIIAKGPNIKKNYHIERASIFDVTPTILYLLGLPIGSDMDGQVIQELITKDFMKKNPINYITTYDSAKYNRVYKDTKMSDELKKQLKTLGYIR